MQCPTCHSLNSSFDAVCQCCGSPLPKPTIDVAAIKHKVNSIIEKKCPNCGAPLKTNTCEFCGSEFVGVVDGTKPKAPAHNDCGGTCFATCVAAGQSMQG